MSKTAPKPSKVWLLALPVAAVAAGFGLWTVTSSTPDKPKASLSGGPSATADPSLVAIAVQPADLPGPSVKCPFSGDMAAYVERMKAAGPDVFERVSTIWKQLREHGATAGYVVYWGDTVAACDAITNPSDAMDHGAGSKHPTTTFSVVVRYESPAGAESAFRDNVFQQASLKGAKNYVTTEGADTGLGPNSVVALTPEATIPLQQAVWQNGTVTVLYGSENLPLTASRSVTESVNRRIGP